MQVDLDLKYNKILPNFQKKIKTNYIIKDFKADIFQNSKHFEITQFRNIYNELWKELALPENLKPRLQFEYIFSNCGFSLDDYTIYFNKNRIESPFKTRIEHLTGKTKALLRHEIEHVVQIWRIIKLLGAENIQKEFDENVPGMRIKVTRNLMKKMREIEKTLGPLNLEEEIKAKKNLNSLRSYKDINKPNEILSINQLINFIKYYFNDLEVEARQSEKKYSPSFYKTLVITLKESYNMIFKSKEK